MSGTIGTTPHRWSTRPAVAVALLWVRLRRSVVTVRVAGGLPLPFAVPLALTRTASVLWVTITVAGSWVS
jgi:hypothetical protein